MTRMTRIDSNSRVPYLRYPRHPQYILLKGSLECDLRFQLRFADGSFLDRVTGSDCLNG